MQTARALEVVVEDAYALQPLPFRHACQHFVDDLAEVITVLAHAGRIDRARTLRPLCFGIDSERNDSLESLTGKIKFDSLAYF